MYTSVRDFSPLNHVRITIHVRFLCQVPQHVFEYFQIQIQKILISQIIINCFFFEVHLNLKLFWHYSRKV